MSTKTDTVKILVLGIMDADTPTGDSIGDVAYGYEATTGERVMALIPKKRFGDAVEVWLALQGIGHVGEDAVKNILTLNEREYGMADAVAALMGLLPCFEFPVKYAALADGTPWADAG